MRRSARAAAALALVLLAFSCQSQTREPTGGETHFLRRCEPSSDSCGRGLACVCNVCTIACSGQVSCGAFPGAECVASNATGACSEPLAQSHCDVQCARDADCSALSAAHRCEDGVCRAGLPVPSVAGSGGAAGAPALGGTGGSGGTAGSGGTSTELAGRGGSAGSAGSAGTSNDAGAAGSLGCVRGEVSANQVLVIGDIFMAANHQITAYLEEEARAAGVLASGERYRDNSRTVGNALAVQGNGIADQYAAGVAEAPVEVVIMNGGGADILIGSCDGMIADCPVLIEAAAGARDLLATMAADGVDHVVYAFYPDPLDAALREKMDGLRPLIQSACEESAVACHWLDLRPSFTDHYDEYVMADGITPNAAGAQVCAQAIWATMEQYCVAQ